MRYVLIVSFAWVICAGAAVAQIPTARQSVLDAERARPTDPWPRGQGHVVFALPGSVEEAKAYHEPGGSFSPEFGSFGVSLWITDSHGAILHTSDSIPLTQFRQHFVWQEGAAVPAIRTETAEYVAEWSLGSVVGASNLVLDPKLAADHKLMLVIRSVGPAGTALQSLRWSGGELLVNGRYRLQVTPGPASIYVGTEGAKGWITATAANSGECQDDKGWCYARLELPRNPSTSLRIVDTFPPRNPGWTALSTRSNLKIEVPDNRFADSLNAQVAHLMMGLVDYQTRPGDPNQYPLAWLRDGAYQVVALARAGELSTARELARYFAEKDFFGGFGAEADNPGLALWAMEEVASRLREPDYDRYLWPHVHRKAEFILGMMATREPIERVFAGILVPEHRADPDAYQLAHPSENGLITGRMDAFYPAMYVTAVSYYGLLSAAELAQRLNYTKDSSGWRSAALKLKQAWSANYQPTDKDDRTFLNGVSSISWIAADPAAYQRGLEREWNEDWDVGKSGFRDSPHRISHGVPLWTYFTFETADQFLLLGEPKPTWDTLEWFWNHQPSPGLYSWWESDTDENTFHQWEYVRGWTHPQHVTPHYQTAAACLLMQLDMLAYLDGSSPHPALVIGGGVPVSWSGQHMSVHGLMTKVGRVDWEWDGKSMLVKMPDDRVPVRLGPSFPRGAKVRVEASTAD
jgi:hypothetical protein